MGYLLLYQVCQPLKSEEGALLCAPVMVEVLREPCSLADEHSHFPLDHPFISCLTTSGMDVLNTAIEDLVGSRGRDQWTPSVVSVSDSVMQADQAEVRLLVILATLAAFSSYQVTDSSHPIWHPACPRG